jgi:hypothetical protein
MADMVHSWLITPDQAIIDVLPIGIITAGSILVPRKGRYNLPSLGVYTTSFKLVLELKNQIETEETLSTAKFLAAIMQHALNSPF